MRAEVLAESIQTASGTYVRGASIDGPENDLRPLVETGSAKWLEGPEGEDALQADRTLWPLNGDQARALAAKTDDPILLRSWLAGERRNPRYRPEGRKGVKDAIEERLGELQVQTEEA